MPLRKDTKYKEYFYRYRHFDDDGCIESLQLLLTKNEIRLSSPQSFNDPYDCRPHFVANGTESQKRTYIKTICRNANPTLTKGDVNALATKLLKKLNSPGYDFETIFKEEYYNKLVPSVGMICVSKVPDNILMWSHYAASHSGICLEFEANVKTDSAFLIAQEVKYTNEYPVIDFSTCSKEEILDNGLLTKSIDWEYEREYRVIFPAEMTKLKIPEESLTGVIFGLKTSAEHKGLVLKWIETRKKKPTLYEARMKQRQFGIDFVKIG
jgi:hypothetical protein